MKNGPYILVRAPEDYPGKKYRGRYVYEHTLVWWQTTGQLVPDGWLVHHKDENKHNNSFSNLELKSTARHTSDHHTLAPVRIPCAYCGAQIERKQSEHRFRTKIGQSGFYCDRSCEAKHRWQRDGGFSRS